MKGGMLVSVKNEVVLSISEIPRLQPQILRQFFWLQKFTQKKDE